MFVVTNRRPEMPRKALRHFVSELMTKILTRLVYTFGNEVARYKGEVIDIEVPGYTDGVRIAFRRDNNQLIRVFPNRRVEAIGAAFPTAAVEYAMYELGAVNISVLRYIGPPRGEMRWMNEPLDKLSEAELLELEDS